MQRGGGYTLFGNRTGWPSRLFRWVMSAVYASLGMNLLCKIQPCLNSKNINADPQRESVPYIFGRRGVTPGKLLPGHTMRALYQRQEQVLDSYRLNLATNLP